MKKVCFVYEEHGTKVTMIILEQNCSREKYNIFLLN